MGPGVTGLVKDRIGKPQNAWTTAGPAASTCRASEIWRTSNPNFIRGYGFEGERRHDDVSRARDRPRPASARRSRRRSAITPARYISMGGFGEVLPRYENYMDPRSGA